MPGIIKGGGMHVNMHPTRLTLLKWSCRWHAHSWQRGHVCSCSFSSSSSILSFRGRLACCSISFRGVSWCGMAA